MISGMVREKGVAAILAMHDLNLASRFSDNDFRYGERKGSGCHFSHA